MTPRATVLVLFTLILLVCGAGLLFLGGAFQDEGDVDPRSTSSTPRSDGTSSDDAGPEEGGTAASALSGTVLDTSAMPVADSRVELHPLSPDALRKWGRASWLAGLAPLPRTAPVSPDGSYGFGALKPGLYGIRALAPEYASEFAIVTKLSGDLTVDLTLVRGLVISGTVRDAATDRPLPGTSVVAMRQPPGGVLRGASGREFLRAPRARTETDGAGAFRMAGLPPGHYELITIREGYHRAVQGVRAGGKPVHILLRPGSSLRGTIVDADRSPVSGARIYAFSDGHDLEGEAVSGDDGRFRAFGLSAGTKTIVIYAHDLCSTRREGVAIDLGRETDLGDVVLERGGTLAGRVVDEEGSPLAGARVTIQPVGAVPHEPVATDVDGSFESGGLPTGQILLAVECDGYAKYEKLGVQPPTRELEIVLRRTGTLRLRVVSKIEDRPLTAYWAKVHRQEGNMQLTLRNRLTAARRPLEGDAQGSGRIEGLDPGKYTVEAGAEGHGPATITDIEVPGGGESQETLVELGAGAQLVGRVLRKSDDTPVAGARITVNVLLLGMLAAARSDVVTTTDEDGSFRLPDLAAGSISICVSHPDFPEIECRHNATPKGEGEPVIIRLPAGGRIRGTVYGEDGRPLAGSRVVLQPGTASVLVKMATTDAEGGYEFESFAPGPVRVVWLIDAARGKVRVAQVVVVEDGEVTADFHAVGEGSRVTGTVSNEKGPVTGAAVVLIPVDAGADRNSALRTGQTDEKGAFELKGLPPGKYILQAVVNQLGARRTVSLTVPEGGGEIVRDVRLFSGTIEGRVVDAAGKPVSEALVFARRSGRFDDSSLEELALGIVGQALTGGDGTFEVEGLAAGTYILRVQHAAHGQGGIVGIVLADGQTRKGVTIELPAAAELVLNVSGPSGPVNEALVQLTDREGSPITLVATPLHGENGRFSVPSVAPGTYRLVVVAKGLAAAVVKNATVTARGVTEIPVRLLDGGTVRVVVVDEDGKPVPGVRARAESIEDGGAPHILDPASILRNPPATGADGVIDLDHVPPGRFRVKASIGNRSAVSEDVIVVRDGSRVEVRVVLPR